MTGLTRYQIFRKINIGARADTGYPVSRISTFNLGNEYDIRPDTGYTAEYPAAHHISTLLMLNCSGRLEAEAGEAALLHAGREEGQQAYRRGKQTFEKLLNRLKSQRIDR